MPLVTLKTEVVPGPKTKAAARASLANAVATSAAEAAAAAATNAATSRPTEEFRMLPHYWDCVEAGEWDWGPKGRPLPVSPKNPRAGSF